MAISGGLIPLRWHTPTHGWSARRIVPRAIAVFGQVQVDVRNVL